MKNHGKQIISDHHQKRRREQLFDFAVDFVVAAIFTGFIIVLIFKFI